MIWVYLWYNQIMKLCGMCKEVKPFSDFRKRTKVKDGHGSWCRKCYAEYDRKRYKENASERERKKRNKQKLIERNKKFIWDFLLKNPCVDCGEKNLIVLEFDHINPHDKEYNVSEMLNLSLIKIKKEIEKYKENPQKPK